jgi:GH25 family lysozyme M1 (1,4-beta-N-acetylmuramidase)
LTSEFTDVSSNNPTPDLRAYANSGARLIGIKATEGTGYVWSNGRQLADAARSLGLRVLRYHFAKPGVDGAAQARFFLAQCNEADIPCLDMEGTGWAAGEVERVTASFCATVEAERGPGVVYIGAYFTHIPWPKGWRWWLPAYTATMPANPVGYPDPWAWQHTDHGSLPGMKAPGDVSTLLDALDPTQPSKPTGPHDCPHGLVWWDGHGCTDPHNIPKDAQGVSTPTGAAMAYWDDGKHGWTDVHNIPADASHVLGFTYTDKGWVRS